MQTSVADIFQRSTNLSNELTQFHDRVRPTYADTLMNLWDTLFKPLERLANYFQRSNTESFVAEFEASWQANQARKNSQ